MRKDEDPLRSFSSLNSFSNFPNRQLSCRVRFYSWPSCVCLYATILKIGRPLVLRLKERAKIDSIRKATFVYSHSAANHDHEWF